MVNPYLAPSETVAAPGSYASEGAGAVSSGSIEALRQTRPWVLLLAIMGLIGAGLALLAGVAVLASGAMAGGSSLGGKLHTLFALVYLVLAPIYALPSVKLMKYASAISRLVQSGTTAELHDALLQQKGFWKLVGIMVIAMLVVYALIFAGIILSAAAKVGH